MITIKRREEKMQEQASDWKEEINKIAERSIRRSREILRNLKQENLEEIDDNENSDIQQN